MGKSVIHVLSDLCLIWAPLCLCFLTLFGPGRAPASDCPWNL